MRSRVLDLNSKKLTPRFIALKSVVGHHLPGSTPHGKCSRPSPFIAVLPLPCIIRNSKQKKQTRTGEGLGMRLVLIIDLWWFRSNQGKKFCLWPCDHTLNHAWPCDPSINSDLWTLLSIAIMSLQHVGHWTSLTGQTLTQGVWAVKLHWNSFE